MSRKQWVTNDVTIAALIEKRLTLREIADRCGTHPSVIQSRVRAMEQKGLVTNPVKKARMRELTEAGREWLAMCQSQELSQKNENPL